MTAGWILTSALAVAIVRQGSLSAPVPAAAIVQQQGVLSALVPAARSDMAADYSTFIILYNCLERKLPLLSKASAGY